LKLEVSGESSSYRVYSSVSVWVAVAAGRKTPSAELVGFWVVATVWVASRRQAKIGARSIDLIDM
jgi:hypothetical protein